MQDIYGTIANLKEQLNDKLTHPFLVKNITAPVIDEDKLLLFYALFEDIQIEEDKKSKYILTAMLVQIALDTHDEVSVNQLKKMEQMKQRQLTVLAGDYFSGLYYALLSELQDIPMIRTLAKAIKEINEHKIRLYTFSSNDIQDLYKSITIVETALYKQIARHFQSTKWEDFIINFLSFKRLMNEKKRLESGLSNINKTSHLHLNNNPKMVCEHCNRYFKEAVSILEKGIGIHSTIGNVFHTRMQSMSLSADYIYPTLNG
ncbi:heptaprenyl diphosphate synthase component 1 [Metabacillus arenae]|uniref:Heptaprenyl diphosphate synthase component 1 n=1 Tax=Metabacillus arenae TaxID=2771434 RepID=A0A926RVB5_9BACI|nr:heptaprenyl diphosphate synthase component 1 [Metabacillus arenae]MBD1378616.1 heptaprenyl diphosphate synthase component 1 [Metabacillus arenae]